MACSAVTPGATQIAFAVGLIVWLGFMLTTFMGKDPRIPVIGAPLQRAAETDPAGEVEL
jgi:uncharacterized membrane protein